MNTLSKFDKNLTAQENETREEKVKFFTKRFLALSELGQSSMTIIETLIEDDYVALVYPKLVAHFKPYLKDKKNLTTAVEDFEDFSTFYKTMIRESNRSGDSFLGLRALLSTSAYEENLKLNV